MSSNSESTISPSSSNSVKDYSLVIATSGVTTLNVFLNGALTVALPTIGKDLQFRQADLQWPLAVYALSYGCLLLFFGRVGDIVGGRTMFLLGSTWFAIWSLGAAFAPSAVTFIIFVGLQGLGAAANTPAGIRILTTAFPAGKRRNQSFGILGAGQAVGYISGLVAGGLLAESRATWRAIFYIQTGLGLFFVVLGWFALDKDREDKRYTKGLDWGGAALSTVAIALLTYSLADSTVVKGGWGAPQIPSLFAVSLLLLSCFLYYERWREIRGLAVLMPLSMWNQPGAKMGSMATLVFFAWFSFNSINYLITLYFQQVKLLNPLQTAVRFIPTTIAGFIVNIVTGYTMSRIPGQYLILTGLLGSISAPLIFALIDVNSSYWAMAFLVLILVVGADAVYPVGNLQVCSAFADDSQALAGGVFNVATRIGTSIGLAVISSISTAVSSHYNRSHPSLAPDSPEVLMVGFRAAGWACFAAALVSFCIALLRLKGMGIVKGRTSDEERRPDDVELQQSSRAGTGAETK
ncbi:major facilitator superfamily domain-containing protein [Mycena capillaripes]|nr:major facilitator superfamily domain-containing protein [Mycena capillaripes]